ncbi:MAG: hypothetical protein ISS83_01355 [Candidatus Pacebacteria bacterium]|nr:hypothetical protein [Candidatus Paceibacterota bacterium]
MAVELTKEIAQKIMETKGEARGIHFKNDAEFVLREKGKEGLAMIEKELEGLGYPINYKKISQFDFYPIGLRALSLLAIKKTFDWSDAKIKELCKYAMNFSWVIKLLMKYLSSVEKVAKETPKTWSQYFTVGQAAVQEYDLKKKYAIITIKDFRLHPVYCRCFEGVVPGVLKMVIASKKIVCEEIECVFNGGKEHKFLIKWQ